MPTPPESPPGGWGGWTQTYACGHAVQFTSRLGAPDPEVAARFPCPDCRCDCNPLGRAHEPGCPLAADGDAVNHPAHYGGADDPYEAIKVIEAWGLDFHLGNTVKYVARAGKKGDTLEDLQKAAWYLDRAIQRLAAPTPGLVTSDRTLTDDEADELKQRFRKERG